MLSKGKLDTMKAEWGEAIERAHVGDHRGVYQFCRDDAPILLNHIEAQAEQVAMLEGELEELSDRFDGALLVIKEREERIAALEAELADARVVRNEAVSNFDALTAAAEEHIVALETALRQVQALMAPKPDEKGQVWFSDYVMRDAYQIICAALGEAIA